MLDCERPSLERQLLSNQVWETVAFIAKAAFMIGLTPWMIRTWGAQGYGEFALASATFVLLSVVDLGIRAKTRLALCNAREKDRAQWPHIVLDSVVTFSIVGVLTIAASFVLTATGVVNALFKISAANRNLFFITTTMSILVMLSGLLLEPLAAVGRIGKLKLATAGGWLTAIPFVALVLATKGPVISALIVWLGCLLGANLLVLFVGNRSTFRASALRPQLEFGRLVATLKEGFWFNICNATWTTKTYGTTLLISAISNPATAGLFFILLRLSEIISGLGAISCDVSLGELAHAKTVSQRRQSFESSYSWAAILCCHFAVILGFTTNDFCRIWLHSSWLLPAYAGAIVAALGLSSALNRKAIYVGSGLGAVKLAAKCSLVEAGLFLALMGFLPRSLALMNRLGLATVAVVALIPIVLEISRRLLVGSIKLWLQPLSSIAPFAAASAAVLLFGALAGRPMVKICATTVSGVILLFNVLYWRKTRLPRLSEFGLTSTLAVAGPPAKVTS